MAEVNLFIRDSGDGNFSQHFGPGEDWADSASEDIENSGTFSQLRVAVFLYHNTLSPASGNIYLRVNGGSGVDETVFLVNFLSLQRNNPIWFEANFTNGPYSFPLGSKIDFHVHMIGGSKVGHWVTNNFNGSTDLWVKSYGTELSAPEKPINPTPTDTDTGIVLLPTLSWEAG